MIALYRPVVDVCYTKTTERALDGGSTMRVERLDG